ncbi:MAG: hypothetical protein ACRYF7_23590 [Janthinobacterium lividum]
MGTMTMKMKTLSSCTLLGIGAALILAAHAAGTQQKAHGSQTHAAVPAPQAFPATLARYQARVFELIEPGENKYDAGFAHQLRSLVAPQLAKNAKFLARVTSGPTDVGTYVISGQRAYIHYGVCQAHQCDNTTLDLLFDPSRNRMVGKLLDSCAPYWLGQPDNAERTLLEQRHRVSFPAAVTACASAK